MVFVNGVVFSCFPSPGVREKIVKAIPYALKIAITCGIGLFIGFIGRKNGGVIVANQATYVSHGDFTSPPVALWSRRHRADRNHWWHAACRGDRWGIGRASPVICGQPRCRRDTAPRVAR